MWKTRAGKSKDAGCLQLTVFISLSAVPEVNDPMSLPCFIQQGYFKNTSQRRRYAFALSLIHPSPSLDKWSPIKTMFFKLALRNKIIRDILCNVAIWKFWFRKLVMASAINQSINKPLCVCELLEDRHIYLRGLQVILMMCHVLKIIHMFSGNIAYHIWPTWCYFSSKLKYMTAWEDGRSLCFWNCMRLVY